MRWLSLVVAMTVACAVSAGCARPAKISDAWAVAAGPSGVGFVERARPVEGAPLIVTAGRKQECVLDTSLLGILGPVCDHESENRPPPQPAIDLPPGIPEPTPEVRWYCGGKLAVRVVFQRCDATGNGHFDGVRPLEVAVATHP